MSYPGDTSSQKRLDLGVLSPLASQIVEKMDAQDVLAYGGWPPSFIKGFRPHRKLTIQSYKPQVEGANSIALPADVVVSVDYLSEVGMLGIHDRLDDLKRTTLKAGFIYVSVPEFPDDIVTNKTINKPINWWISEFSKRFDLQTFQRLPGGFYVIVYPMIEQVLH